MDSSPIRVRVYDIPPRFWTQKNATAIANKIGSVISIDRMWRNGFPTNEYIRLRVSISLLKPLFVVLFLPMEEGVSLWCYFKYEHLPFVCYKCGIVGHDESICWRQRRMITDDFNNTVPMYGPWMRLGFRKKDCFSDYALYEQERFNREVSDIRVQEVVEQNLCAGVEDFEPALVGTEIHMEALLEAETSRQGGEKSQLVQEDVHGLTAVAEGNPISKKVAEPSQGHSGPSGKSHYVHEKEGQKDVVVGDRFASDMKDVGPTIFSNFGSKGKHIADMDEMGKRPSCAGASGPEKKRKLEGPMDPTLDIISEPINIRELNGGLKKSCPEPSDKPIPLKIDTLLGSNDGGNQENEEKASQSLIKNDSVVQRGGALSDDSKRLGKCTVVDNEDFSMAEEAGRIMPPNSTCGLALFWRRGWDLQVINSDFHKITVRFGKDRTVPEWISCFTYAPPCRSLRLDFWKELSVNMSNFSCPWIVMGDLNSILSADEKCGGRPVTRAEGQGLREFIFNLGGIDLEGVGAIFTWTNGKNWKRLIREKLDRVVVSADWISNFKKAGVRNLAVRHSDHGAIVLDTRMDREVVKTPFRFLDAWSRDPGCRRIIDEAWNIAIDGFHSFMICRRLHSTAQALSKWNREVFGHCQFKLQALERLLTEVQNRIPTKENVELEGSIMLEIDEVEKRLESIWKQKSRENWLKEGDCNTKFFHASVAVRRKRSFIWAIKKEDGSWIEGRDHIGDYFRNHFLELFSSTNSHFNSDLEDLFEPCISNAENNILNQPPTSEEIKKVVWSMPPLKSPGPDGFPTKFFKDYWDIVGPQTIEFVQEFFRSGNFSKEINRTFIVLIPKRANANCFDEFRPISLCNTTYKIVAKLLANRLSMVLDKIISPNQSAFVQGRWIVENSIIANELLLNGGLTKTFYPKRGLRQGDPVSPYLFIIGAEVLTRILLSEESKGNLNGFSFSREGPSISHLMYADDLLIFLKADQRNRETVIKAIDKYCNWSGQRINVSKSKLFFSKNCSARCREEFLQISSRLEGWRANLLSQAARMTLIKSVLASIPIYTMSTFLLPRKTTDRIDSIVRKFWWTGQSKEGRYLSLKAWDSLYKPKACGGLGFRRAKDINFCLLAKLGWDLASGTLSLWTSVINAKYCRTDGFLSAPLPFRASPVARGIWATQDFITENSVWIGGQNSSIDFWCQQWQCGDGPILHKGAINPVIKNLNLVSDLVDIDSSGWNARLVEEVFVPDAASMIIASDRNSLPVVDIPCWKSSMDGKFSLKAAYWDYNKSRFAEKDNICGNIWLAKIHERFKVFLWKLCQDALPFGSKLQSIFGKPPGPYALSSLNGRDLVAWLLHPPFQHLLNSHELYSFFLYGTIMYHKLWFCRNDAYHNGIPVEFKLLQKNIETCFFEHEKIRTVEIERPDLGLGLVDYRWGLPRPGRVRGFVDFASNREMGAVAVVLFDASGSVMAAGAKKVVVHDAFQGELEALLFGVSLALQLQIEGVDFHSDNSTLVKGLMDRNSPSWRSHFSFTKLYDLLLSSDCSVSWISRVLNKAAHTLAKWGLSHSCNGLLRFWEVSPHVLTRLCVLA
uniref:Reverse transcriptase domain-containing protein n=1 Tax=Cannabis sativa TaxID=3483 RepID=A0A803Q0M3_CANSA